MRKAQLLFILFINFFHIEEVEIVSPNLLMKTHKQHSLAN